MKQAIIVILCAITPGLNAQKQCWNWYFHGQAALNFSTGVPIQLNNSAMPPSSSKPCTSISDTSGNLLFYSDGQYIWNRNHVVMANGTITTGSTGGARQPIISTQAPGKPDIYYIFSTGISTTNCFGYTVIDMSLAAGLGSVTLNFTTVTCPVYQAVAVTSHCNGIDKWVLVHERNTNRFMSFLITNAGVSPLPVSSLAGVTHTGSADGTLKFSPDGARVAMSSYMDAHFELFDFDAATGLLSNPMLFVPNSGYPNYASGIEFSPDGSKLYGSGHHSGKLYQWDLCALTASSIAATCKTIAIVNPMINCLQLGPDGKIYTKRIFDPHLGVINNPDLAGVACNFTDGQLSMNTGTVTHSLPSFESHLFRVKSPPFTYSVSGCTTVGFSVPPQIPMQCTTQQYLPQGYFWNFGDASSATNTSTLSHPTHTFSTGGSRQVKLAISYKCHTDTLVQAIDLSSAPSPSVTGSFSTCAGTSVAITASGAASFSWSSGHTTSTVSLSPSVTTAYSIIATTGTCTSSKYFTLTAVQPPVLNVSGNTSICKGETAIITASGSGSFLWSNGSTNAMQSLKPTFSTTISVTETEVSNPCSATRIVTITVAPCNSYAEYDDEEFLIYPNPTQGVIFVRGKRDEVFSVVLYDIHGRVAAEKTTANSPQSQILEFTIKPGLYYLRFISERQVSGFSKIIVTNHND